MVRKKNCYSNCKKSLKDFDIENLGAELYKKLIMERVVNLI